MNSGQINGWLFGDVGRPLFDDLALAILLSQLPPEIADGTLAIAKKFDRKIIRKRPKAQKSILDECITELISIFNKTTGEAREDLNQNVFNSLGTKDELNVFIHQLPWKPETEKLLRNAGVLPDQPLSNIEGITWGAIWSGDREGLIAIFDIYQMIFSYLPTAVELGVLPESQDSLDVEASKFEKAVLLRSGLAGNYLEKWSALISSRNGWACSKKTLDTLGEEGEVSRERVRQIEETLMAVAQSRNYATSNSIKKINAFDYGSRMADPILVISQHISINDEWTTEALENYILVSNSPRDLEEFRSAYELDSGQKVEVEKIHQGIRDARTMIGVIHLTGVKVRGQSVPLAREIVIEHLPYVYPNALIAGDFAVVSRGKNAGLFTAIANQLFISPRLHVDQLRVGIERHATQRQAQHLIPPAGDLLRIISQNDDFDVEPDGFVSGRTEEIPAENVQGWLVQQILNSNGRVVSKSHLFRLALAQGYHLTSIAIYLSFSSVIRSLGDGLVTLVGSVPNETEIQYAERVASASYVQNRIVDYRVDPAKNAVIIRFIFSTPFLVSGVVPVEKPLGLLLGSDKRSIECCSAAETEAFAKVSKGTNLAGLASIREHMMVEHGFSEGDTVTLEAGPHYLKVVTLAHGN